MKITGDKELRKLREVAKQQKMKVKVARTPWRDAVVTVLQGGRPRRSIAKKAMRFTQVEIRDEANRVVEFATAPDTDAIYENLRHKLEGKKPAGKSIYARIGRTKRASARSEG